MKNGSETALFSSDFSLSIFPSDVYGPLVLLFAELFIERGKLTDAPPEAWLISQDVGAGKHKAV